jgi:hypothetical protein
MKVWFRMFNATFNNISVISWRSLIFAEETRVKEKNESEDVFAMMKGKTYKRTNNGLQIRKHTDPAT